MSQRIQITTEQGMILEVSTEYVFNLQEGDKIKYVELKEDK